MASELCSGLVERGHTVNVLTLRTCPAPAIEIQGGLTVRRLPAWDLTRWLGVQFSVSLSVLSPLAGLIRRFRPHLVHAHNLFFRTTEAAAILRMIFKVPLVTTLHLGGPEGGGRLITNLIRTYEATTGRFIVRRSDHVVAVSRAVAEHARHMAGGSTPVTVIPNGVDTALFYPRPGRCCKGQAVLFVGRLVANKGPETLIRAAPRVLAHHPQAQFLLAGDGPLKVRLQELAHQLGVGDAVHFLGIRHDVPDLMRQAALFVRPSSLEGMPLTVLEAMASSLPVAATPVAGTAEIIQDGVNGYLVPVGDSAALADAVIKLLDDPSLAREMGQRGRELAESGYTWESAVEQTEHLYEEICRK